MLYSLVCDLNLFYCLLFGRTQHTRGRPVASKLLYVGGSAGNRVWCILVSGAWLRVRAGVRELEGPARCRVMAELDTARVRLVPGDSLGVTLETRRRVHLIPGDSLSATLETREAVPEIISPV